VGTRMKITDLDEGIFDLFSRGSQASGLNNIGNMVGKTQADVTTVDRRVKELLDSGMPDPQIVQTLQREFGLNPRAATQQVNIVKATMEESDNFDLSPQQRKLANLGRVLMDQATTTKNDELANIMAKVGNELTNFGATFGPKNLKDLSGKTDVPPKVIQKLVAYADKIYSAKTDLSKDHKKGGLNDSIHETTSAGAVAAVAAPVGGMVARQMKNSNGTVKNALDMDTNILGGPKKNKKSKKA
jgi:DNA-binding Lrp family transcriptional regulator